MEFKAFYRLHQLTRSVYYTLPLPVNLKRSLLRNTARLRNIFSIPSRPKTPLLPTNIKEQTKRLEKLSFPFFEEPKISVLIPCYEQISYTLNCLESIAAHQPSIPYEVIVIDDASPSNDYKALEGVNGLYLIRNKSNQGFIKNCNHGAVQARGEYLYFLNNDTLLLPGTIDELFNTFAFFPQTGLAGSRLIYQDGRLQEAGGIVWNDGSAANVGRFEPCLTPLYNYLREVDYCSGASLMIPRKLFLDEGGFDPCYCPAYYEDTDLAMRLRSKGYKIHYQPLSTLVHYEGISNGRNEGSGVKKFQETNQVTFQKRWKNELSQHYPWGHPVEEAMNRQHPKRVLLVETTTPRPDRDAGSICVLNLMILLRSMGFQPSFFADNNNAREAHYTQLCEGLGIEMLAAPFITSLDKHLKTLGNRYDLVILFRPDLCHERLPLIQRFCPNAKIMYFPHDLHYWRFEREAEVKRQPSLKKRAQIYRQIELNNSRECDATIVLSQSEHKELVKLLPNANIFLLPLIIQSSGKSTSPGQDKKRHKDIVFIGNFRHSPNEDAVIWFVRNSLPLIIEAHPSIVFHVVGGGLTPALNNLASKHVRLHDFIKDLDDFLANMQISVVPLRFGAGVKGKIASAMRATLPVVSTTIGVEGIPVRDGENVIIADSAISMACSIIDLLNDPNKCDRVSAAGRRFADEQWGEEASFKALESILCSLGVETIRDKPCHPLPLYPFTQTTWPGAAL